MIFYVSRVCLCRKHHLYDLKGKIGVIFKYPGTVQVVNREALAVIMQLKEEKYLMIQDSLLRLLKAVASKEKSFVAFFFLIDTMYSNNYNSFLI